MQGVSIDLIRAHNVIMILTLSVTMWHCSFFTRWEEAVQEYLMLLMELHRYMSNGVSFTSVYQSRISGCITPVSSASFASLLSGLKLPRNVSEEWTPFTMSEQNHVAAA